MFIYHNKNIEVEKLKEMRENERKRDKAYHIKNIH